MTDFNIPLNNSLFRTDNVVGLYLVFWTIHHKRVLKILKENDELRERLFQIQKEQETLQANNQLSQKPTYLPDSHDGGSVQGDQHNGFAK